MSLGLRATRAELRRLFEEVADIDWKSPAWRGLVAALAASEVWQSRDLAPGPASEAFVTALQAHSGPVADTFMASYAPHPPKDEPGRIERAAQRAVRTMQTLRAHDRDAPGQRLLQVLGRRGGWLVGEPLPEAARASVAFISKRGCLVATVDARELTDDPEGIEGWLARALRSAESGQRLPEGLSRLNRDAREPTPAAAAICLEPVSERWARSFHRAAWSRGGGPWMGVADSPPYQVVSTCHCAVDGYAHARVCADVLEESASSRAGIPTPVSSAWLDPLDARPPEVGFASLVIRDQPPRFADALHAFGTVLDRHLGGGPTRSVPFHVPIAPGRRGDSARWRRRPLYGLMALRREGGTLESPAALRARLPGFLEREASGRGLLTRVLRATIGLPVPDAVRRQILAQPSADRWFSPARILTGGGYLSWMRFPDEELPPRPTFPSAIPSFTAQGRGGAGLSIAGFSDGLAVGITTSGGFGSAGFAETFLEQWFEALPHRPA